MTSQEVWMFATGKLVNKLYQNFCHLTGFGQIYISGYKQTLVRFHLRSNEIEKHFSVVLFRLEFGCKFGKINFSMFFCQI